ncbi:FAD/NAD(P)-binding domain-containing protein [Rostrohypoxylon terebratum]|nr:FAD/NAD(P)-binding domain-containing protein [Rostrohypoxylon terebratum]
MPPRAKAPTPDLVDVLIIGGGPTGLTSAVSIARNVHTAIVFDSNSYRNERTAHFHMLPTWDGKNPIEFRDISRVNTLEGYETIFYEDLKIEKAKKNDDGLFEVTDENGKVWKGRSLVLASGVIDVPLDIPGFDECWGRCRFHCLFCHGYEQRGSESFGVLAINDVAPIPIALHVTRNAARFTKYVTIYTNGDISKVDDFKAAIGPTAPFTVDNRRITKFALGPNQLGITITFEDGTTKDEAFLGHKPLSKLKSDFLAKQLGLEITPQGDLKVSPPFGETTLNGCFAAGDNSSFLKTTPNAVNCGANSAAGVASHVQAGMYGQKSLSEAMQEKPA